MKTIVIKGSREETILAIQQINEQFKSENIMEDKKLISDSLSAITEKQIRREQKKARTVKSWGKVEEGKTYQDEKETEYLAINNGGTLKRKYPKSLGRRQRRKLGLLPKGKKDGS